jgi:hypothetical protein
MNKSKIVLACIGGVTLVASLALAYFIWSAMSERSERLDELDGAEQSLVNMMKLPVNPSPEAIKAYQANAETYDNWKDEARKLVTTGDMIFEPTTPPALKAFMVEDARRLSALPGRVDGVIVRPEFAFGFKEFVLDGNMPAEADLAKIQREWYDMSVVVEAMSKSGVIEITDLAIIGSAPAPEAEQQADGNRRQRKGAKSAAKAKAAEQAEGPAVTRMRIEFRAMPPALVAVANSLMMSRRFIVVDDLTFSRERDELSEKLGGDPKKAAEAQSGRGGRRGRRGRQEEAEEPAENEVLSGIVTDPMTAPALKVSMLISVYDFRSLETDKTETEEQK